MKRLRRPGFTLPELMVTLAVISLLAALVLPQWGRSLRHQHLKAATSQVRDVLAATRARALQEPAPVGSPTTPETDRRWIYRVERSDSQLVVSRTSTLVDLTSGARTPEGGAQVLQRLAVAEGIALTISPAAGIEFDRHGRAATDGTVTLTAADEAATVRVRAGQTEVALD